ncbi:hypothetical protein [Thermostilla marina]
MAGHTNINRDADQRRDFAGFTMPHEKNFIFELTLDVIDIHFGTASYQANEACFQMFPTAAKRSLCVGNPAAG